MIRRPPRSTQGVSSAASDVYKRQVWICRSWPLDLRRCPSVPWIQAEKPLEVHSQGVPMHVSSHEPMELIRRLEDVVSATNDRQPSSCEPGLRRSGGLLVVLLERFCNCRQSRIPFHQPLLQPHRACQSPCLQTSARSRPGTVSYTHLTLPTILLV